MRSFKASPQTLQKSAPPDEGLPQRGQGSGDATAVGAAASNATMGAATRGRAAGEAGGASAGNPEALIAIGVSWAVGGPDDAPVTPSEEPDDGGARIWVAPRAGAATPVAAGGFGDANGDRRGSLPGTVDARSGDMPRASRVGLGAPG